MISSSPTLINSLDSQNPSNITTACLKHELSLLVTLNLNTLTRVDLLLLSLIRDLLTETLNSHLMQNELLNLPYILIVKIGRLEKSQSDDNRLGRFKGLNNLKIIGKVKPNLGDNLTQIDSLSSQKNRIQSQPENPLGQFEVFLKTDEILVLLYNSLIIQGIVYNLRGNNQLSQSGKLQIGNHLMGLFLVKLMSLIKIDGHGRSLDILGHIYQLLDPRHSQGDILRGNTRKVKSVKSHLSHGLSKGLGCDRSSHLPRSDFAQIEGVFDLIKKIVKSVLKESVLKDDLS